MSIPPTRYRRRMPRYRLANTTRFIAVLLVFILAITAIIIAGAASRNNNENEPPSDQSSVVVTPVATPTPEPTPVIPEGKTMEPVLVVIDAGHGGRDPGTSSPYDESLMEKDIVLDIAKKVDKYLQDKGIKTILTRDGDNHLNDKIDKDLLERADIANRNNASLFVSIHVNAYDLKYKGAASVNGMEVYYLNKDPVYSDFTDERYAEIVANKIQENTGIKFNGTISRSLSVLRNTKMPAVLVETAYITNREDEARLRSDEFRENTARGIADGIEAALNEIGAFEYQGGLYVFKEAGE